MTKLTPPPLNLRVSNATFRHHDVVAFLQGQHEESFRAGIDAVIALLRSPDEAKSILDGRPEYLDPAIVRRVMLAFADLLEARRG
jgi:hypothetical protein